MAKIPATFDITNITKGTDVRIEFQFNTVDADGVKTPLNLTGYDSQFNAKRQLSDPNSARVLAFVGSVDDELDITDIATGLVVFKPNAVATAAWTFNNAFYNIIMISGGSPAQKFTYLKGRLVVDRSA